MSLRTDLRSTDPWMIPSTEYSTQNGDSEIVFAYSNRTWHFQVDGRDHQQVAYAGLSSEVV